MHQQSQDYTTNFVVDQTPAEVFAAVANPRAWWSESIEGETDKRGAVFDYHYQDVHRCKLKIIEFVPNERVVWRVLENHFSFTQDKTEWVGTDIIFEIFEKDGKTELRFTHRGLVPQYECYGVCSEGWGLYITGSLRLLITEGQGRPNKGEPQTKGEQNLS